MAPNNDQQAYLAKDYRHFIYEGLAFASQRGHELSHEFMRLEVQIAAMLFAFSGLFLGFLANVPSLWMRSAFVVALFFLIASIVAGLSHIKRKEKSWDNVVKDRELRFDKWQETVGRDGSFEEARAYDMGVSKGIKEVTSPPHWSWIFQSIFLGIAAAILFAIALVFLFSS